MAYSILCFLGFFSRRAMKTLKSALLVYSCLKNSHYKFLKNTCIFIIFGSFSSIFELLLFISINSPPYATEEQAVKVRHLRRSVMEYTTFDWSKVPRAEQRRLSDKSFDKPQVVTTRFR